MLWFAVAKVKGRKEVRKIQRMERKAKLPAKLEIPKHLLRSLRKGRRRTERSMRGRRLPWSGRNPTSRTKKEGNQQLRTESMSLH
jgi:hypothetical protein